MSPVAIDCLHVRIDPESVPIIEFLSAKNGLYPQFSERKAVRVVNELLKQSPAYQQAKAQMESERNVRPTDKRR